MASGETEEKKNKKSRSKEPVSGFEARTFQIRSSNSKQCKENKNLV